jgi:hypothetical protein
MNGVLCNDDGAADSLTESETDSSVWSPSNGGDDYFVAEYQYRASEAELRARRKQARKLAHDENMGSAIRRSWGSTQEATALLTALNYFSKDCAEFTLEEVGMCGAGLDLPKEYNTLLVGASPDGVLRHNGRIEALEVKNHCPFYTNFRQTKVKRKNKGGKMKRFSVFDRPFDLDSKSTGGVFPHYVPQLMLEMLCLGPECLSAVMMRQTATAGALVLRMHRDDEWIAEMLYWLHRFHSDYVDRNRPPPADFFWNTDCKEDRSRYRRFLNRTLAVRKSNVEVVGRIPNALVQRAGGDAPLFLD